MNGVLQRDPDEKESPAVARYWEGVGALAKKDIKSAEAAFQDSLRLDPSWYGPFIGLAEAAITDGRPEDAESWLKRADAMAPHSVELLTARGRYHFRQGELAKAEAVYKEAISADEKAFLPRLDLADLYLNDLWKPADAVEAYRAVLNMRPNHAGAHYGLGLALIATGNSSEAMVELDAAITREPTNPLPHLALGRLHASRKDYDKALEAIDRALALNPGFAVARVDRGDVLAAKGMVDAAIADYQAALHSAPKLSIAHFKLGSLYELLQRPDDAEAAYIQAIESDPRNIVAYNNLAWLSAERKTRLDDALAWAKRAVELAPDLATYQDTLGWVLRAHGDLDNAADTLEKASVIEPQRADIFYHLGIVYSDQGKNTEALAAFKLALKIDSNFYGAADARSRISKLVTP